MLYTIAVAAALSAPAPAVQEVHPARAAQIAEINQKATTWTAKAHVRFAKEAPGASANLLGMLGNWDAHVKDAVARGEMTQYVPSANFQAPDNWDAMVSSAAPHRTRSSRATRPLPPPRKLTRACMPHRRRPSRTAPR